MHYLLLDPEARRADLFKKYLVAWDSGADAVSAGRAALGNLKTFEVAVKKYVGQENWKPGVVLPGLAGLQGSFVEGANFGARGSVGSARRLFYAPANDG